MVLYKDYITLIDRASGIPVGTTDLPQTGDMERDGDLRPWRIRLELTNTGENGKVNSGVLSLRVDESKTFINTGPILVDENAKRDYLIEAYIEQRDPAGGSIQKGKVFRFQIGSPSIDVQEGYGAILSITLQEIQYRLKETVTSRELRFLTPSKALQQRINDFNNHQGGVGIQIALTQNKLPFADTLQLSYIPQSPQDIQKLIDNILNGLSEPNVGGGVFKDFYYDFDPSGDAISGTGDALTTNMIADEIGRVDSGIILNPLSLDAIDSSQEQTAVNDFVRFKNHVIVRGAPTGGSLPVDESVWSSRWEHAKVSDEWDVGNTVTDRDGVTTYQYIKGQRVKISYSVTLPSGKNKKVIRFFEAKTNVPNGTGTPATNTTYWKEWFLLYPEFDSQGRYFEDDIVYYNTGSEYRFYVANQDILYYTLGRVRSGQQIGGLILPNVFAGWTSLNPTVPDHALNDFGTGVTGDYGENGWFSYTPWTDSVYLWEQNQVGVSESGGEPNRYLPKGAGEYTGLVPDFNMAKDNYGKQDDTDQFENVGVKWVSKRETNSNNITSAEKYHGNRILINGVGQNDFAGHNNQIAEWDKTNGVTPNRWRFSRDPLDNEIVTDLSSGKVLYYKDSDSSWRVAWQINKPTSGFGSNAESTNNKDPNWIAPSPFHLVKDIYKTRGSDGTPSQAMEFRYAWDDEGGSYQERRNSRGAWLWFWNPFPRQITDYGGGENIGSYFGSNGSVTANKSQFTTLSTYNNVSDRFQSLQGWNNGLNTEDMGKIGAIGFRLKVGFFGELASSTNDANHTELSDVVEGFESIPMKFWCIDAFDRIWFTDFKLRRNNKWELVTIQLGDLAPTKRYFARWDELPKFWDIPITLTDFTLLEKQFTGVQFDWRFVRGWGMFYAGSYHDLGHYHAGTNSWWDEFTQSASQSFANLYNIAVEGVDLISDVLTNNFDDEKPERLNYEIRQTTIAIDDLHYIKEQIVNSDDAVVSNARTSIELVPNEEDYENLKAMAKAKRERLAFLPQYWHMRTVGNVNMRIGQRFTVTGDRVPNGSISDLACGIVKHIVDGKGYSMEITARRRFTTTGE